jgi:molecular chaperone DnaK
VDIPPAPRGVPQIEVTFDIDGDGVVNVSAKDLGTGRQQHIRVSASSGLSEEQVKRLLAEAESHAEKDRSRAEMAELRNQASGLIYSTRRTLAEFADHLREEDRSALESALRSAEEATRGADLARLRDAVEELSSLSYKMTEKLYAALGTSSSEQ